MRDNGIEVSEPSPELVKNLQKIGDTMTEEWLERAGESGQALVDAYHKQ
jgi:TRAP-type C4-dicarboxylate transport system substrate-binding protein